ncbi:MAG TPA: imidazoleglycerol-phosphate dehydratase [Gemmatimonadaceae bacterium]|jgi:imidazoleglycerol-phosphate dehydratase|nr:imidazoleglycerol-phosphate dehydratase [Gemmatimonadaceae bacterium]
MKLERNTRETRIKVEMTVGTGASQVRTGLPFLDHMMATLSRYSGLDITLKAEGDLKHHLIEDVAIVTGLAFREILPATCSRYGDRTVAMDDALVQSVVDTGGRFYYRGNLPSGLYDHWMRSFAENARMTLHIRVLRGRDRHHIVEAAFKSLGLALRDALREGDAVFSTKGAVETRRG